MLIAIPGVLDADGVARVRGIVDAGEWIDGNATSGAQSALAKRNEQLPEASEAAKAAGGRKVGAVFRRMRIEDGVRVQRAEVRFDGLAGCLRTPRGGSSRQTLVVVENGQVRSRLISAREGARLMGLPDGYRLPKAATGALHVIGDGVAAPVVRWLAGEILEPLLAAPRTVAAE